MDSHGRGPPVQRGRRRWHRRLGDLPFQPRPHQLPESQRLGIGPIDPRSPVPVRDVRAAPDRIRLHHSSGSTWSNGDSDNGFWGAKLDWNITDNHRLELLAFSDEAETNTSVYGYNFATRTVGSLTGETTAESGGKNGSATYTGHFGENFTAKAMYGINESTSFARSPADGL